MLSTLLDNPGDSSFWTISPSLQIWGWNLLDNCQSLPFQSTPSKQEDFNYSALFEYFTVNIEHFLINSGMPFYIIMWMVAKAQKASQIVYANLISRKSILTLHRAAEMDRGMQYMEGNKCIKRYEAYQLALKYTKSTRLVEFQFKFLHRRISLPMTF